MSNINEVNKSLYIPQDLNDKKTGRANEEPKKDADKTTKESSVTQVNKLIIEMHFSIEIETKVHIESQAGVQKLDESSGFDLSQLSYNGKPITDLSQDEAKALISEDGALGVKNTAQTIFDFAVKLAGDDIEKLQIARDAVIKGFKEAENLFGGKLPDISYKTINKVLELLDEKISGLGGSVVDVTA